jgi:hypothetical protein
MVRPWLQGPVWDESRVTPRYQPYWRALVNAAIVAYLLADILLIRTRLGIALCLMGGPVFVASRAADD